jgi:hypothetical protein
MTAARAIVESKSSPPLMMMVMAPWRHFVLLLHSSPPFSFQRSSYHNVSYTAYWDDSVVYDNICVVQIGGKYDETSRGLHSQSLRW